MPSTRELRRRIKSVKSTRQITKAMELVAASKMRHATEATLASRPYAAKIWLLLKDIIENPLESVTHPLMEARPVTKIATLVITSDRGMAGVYNTAVLKAALEYANLQKSLGREVSFITLGKKGLDGLTKAGQNVFQSYPLFNTHPTAADFSPIAKSIIQSFINQEFDLFNVIYTEFFSMLRQDIAYENILPLQNSSIDENVNLPENSSLEQEEAQVKPEGGVREFIYEPNPSEVLDQLLPQIVEVRLYQALLESLASEHSARRMAMRNATDNASSMLDDLSLTYNSLRQGAITQELAEITSGAAALQNS